MIVADNQPIDRFGYSCYAVVIPASQLLIATVREIRQASGMTRAAIPAHVTVKGTFVAIDDLEEVKRRIAAIAKATPPLYLSFDGATSEWRENGAYLKIPVTPPLQQLHDKLVAALAPLATAAYEDDPYLAHMTYVQDISPYRMAILKERVGRLSFGRGFTADKIELMARVGPAYGGTWRLVRRFPLAAKPKAVSEAAPTPPPAASAPEPVTPTPEPAAPTPPPARKRKSTAQQS